MMSMADMFTQFFSSAPPSDEEPEDTIKITHRKEILTMENG